MFTSIRTSAANKSIVTDLTRKLNLGPENVIARLALAYSLSKGEKLKLTEIKDAKGKEYSKNTLFGDYLPQYIAMICTHYQIHKSDKDVAKYIKIHLDNGLEIINRELTLNSNLSGFDFLTDKVRRGLTS